MLLPACTEYDMEQHCVLLLAACTEYDTLPAMEQHPVLPLLA